MDNKAHSIIMKTHFMIFSRSDDNNEYFKYFNENIIQSSYFVRGSFLVAVVSFLWIWPHLGTRRTQTGEPAGHPSVTYIKPLSLCFRN